MKQRNYVAEKLAIASGLDSLKINNVNFVKGEDVEEESLAEQNNPFIILTRSYQQDTTTTISDTIGLVTQTLQVIGSDSVTAIGDN
jgi:hypothetical protein